MNRLYALAGSLALMVAIATLVRGEVDDKPAAKKAKNHTVKMIDDKFDPKEVTIAVGDTVTWENKGENTHNAVSDDKGKTFDTKNVKPGAKSKAVTFGKAGKFAYECTHHDEMTGTIIVK